MIEEIKQQEKLKEEPLPIVIKEVGTGFTTGDTVHKKLSFGGLSAGGLLPALIVGALLFLITQSMFVAKKDFTLNIQNILGAIESTKSTVAQSLTTQNNEVTTKLNNLSNQVTSQLAVVQSNYATKGSVDALSGLSTTVNNQLATAKTAQDKALADALSSVDSKLTAQSNKIVTDITTVQSEITTLQKQIVELQNQIAVTQSLSNITISGSSNITNIIPTLVVTNSGSTSINTTGMVVKLTLTLPAGINLTGATYPIISNTGTGGIAVIQTTLGTLGITTIAPYTTISILPSISLTSTGTATNSTWLAVWSKQ